MKCQIRASWLPGDGRNAELVARALLGAGVTTCTVTEGWSVCTESPSSAPQLEKSVIIDLYSSDKEVIRSHVWPALQKTLGLVCVHVRELGGFSGCVHAYLGPSVCPHDCHDTSLGGTGAYLRAETALLGAERAGVQDSNLQPSARQQDVPRRLEEETGHLRPPMAGSSDGGVHASSCLPSRHTPSICARRRLLRSP